MRCRVCGRATKKTYGVHCINDVWWLSAAHYCCYHGSFILPDEFKKAVPIKPEPTKSEHIRPGLHVKINVWKNKAFQAPTEGYVAYVITKGVSHSDGIQVILTNGQKGRVIQILE